MTLRSLIPAALCALLIAGCGGSGVDEPATTPPDYSRVKDYVVAHAERVEDATEQLYADTRAYVALAKRAGGDEALLDDVHRGDAGELIDAMQASWSDADAAYQEIAGVAASARPLARFDRALSSGSAGAGKQSAGFDLTYEDGTILKRPGNYFAITETSLWGTNPRYAVQGVQPDLNGDGKVTASETLPLPQHIAAAVKGFHQETTQLLAAAADWRPAERELLAAIDATLAPIGRRFDEWLNSRFVAGTDATQQRFTAGSRLSGITGSLTGLTVVFEAIQPQLAERAGADVATRTGEELEDLLTYVTRLRDTEAGGRRYTPAQATEYGTEAQRRADAILRVLGPAGNAPSHK